jgi:hypothetical protein
LVVDLATNEDLRKLVPESALVLCVRTRNTTADNDNIILELNSHLE